MEKPQNDIKRTIRVPMDIPYPTSKILLHTCCAPCFSAIVEYLLSQGVIPTIYYHNPNIFPSDEYEHRKEECKRFASLWDIPMVDAEYNHSMWLYLIKGLEEEPERGKRCLECFKIRLVESFRYASENGFKVVATTLGSSRWKDLIQIEEAGKYAHSQYPDVEFWAKNWRKGGLSERRNALLKEYQFYNQRYCGCEFSRANASQPLKEGKAKTI